MPDSPLPAEHSHGSPLRRRPCDFCNKSTALLYCRADNAKLCLSCDREVHSTNQLFTKHTRSLLCDGCDSSPASIFCSTDAVVHCQNCDWETHNKSNSNSNSSSPATHDRRPLEGFTGCPSVTDLLSILGFEDLSKKGLLLCGSCEEGSDSYGSGDKFPDYLVWDTPSFVSLDDLIVSSGSEHNYQAMGVPPLPKNRNAAFGAYKDELVRQLRELAKSDPNVDGDEGIIKPINDEFQPIINMATTQNNRSSGFEHNKLEEQQVAYSSNEANTFQWCPDVCDAVGQDLYSDQLHRDDCESLESFGDISNCKLLWKVSLFGKNKLCGDILLNSMLQGNAFENHFISAVVKHQMIPKEWFVDRLFTENTHTLHLPHDWNSNYCGFLIRVVTDMKSPRISIIIKQEVEEVGFRSEIWQEPDEYNEMTFIGYVSFHSLRNTTLLTSSHNIISFSIQNMFGCSAYKSYVGAELVPRKVKGDQAFATTDCSEFWDDERKHGNTFTIKRDSNTSINILWKPSHTLSPYGYPYPYMYPYPHPNGKYYYQLEEDKSSCVIC